MGNHAIVPSVATADPAVAHRVLASSFERYLPATNELPGTIKGYRTAVAPLGHFLAGRGMPFDPAAISREHVETFVAGGLECAKPAATVAARSRALRVFFGWLVDEGGIVASPMRKMKPPRVPEEPPAVLSDDQLARLPKADEGGVLPGEARTADGVSPQPRCARHRTRSAHPRSL